jgi:O-antigen ligase
LFSAGYEIGGVQIGHLTKNSVATEGTFWEANLLGAFLAVTAVALLVWCVLGRAVRTVHFIGLFVSAVALPLTLTRAAGMAAALGAAMVLLVAAAFRRDFPRWRQRLAMTAAVLASAVVLTVTGMNAWISSMADYPNLLVERWLPVLVGQGGPLNPSPSPVSRPAATPPATATPVTGPIPADNPFPATVKVSQRPDGSIVAASIVAASHSSAEGRMKAWRLAVALSADRPWLGHGTLAGGDVVKEGWWYSSVVQSLFDTGVAGTVPLLGIHICGVLLPLVAWMRVRTHETGLHVLVFALGNGVLALTSQFSNAFFVGLPWVLLGMAMGAVDSVGRQKAHDLESAPV